MINFKWIKWLLSLVLLIFFSGCVVKDSPRAFINTEPLIIKNSPKNSKVYIRITDSSGAFENLLSYESEATQVISKNLAKSLTQNGFEVVSEVESENRAVSIKIRGNLDYFRRDYIKDLNPFVLGSINFFHHGIRREDALDDYISSATNSYIYDASFSLEIRVDGEIYRTILNLRSGKNINSSSTMIEIFADEISKEIIKYLKNIKDKI